MKDLKWEAIMVITAGLEVDIYLIFPYFTNSKVHFLVEKGDLS